MARFRCKPCPVGVRLDGRGCEVVRWAAIIPAGGCGAKDQVSRTRAPSIEAQSIEGNGGAKARMELVLKGRGTRVARRVRQVTEHKLGRLERIEPALIRVEVVVTIEKNPRQGGLHRVEAAASTPRRTYRSPAPRRRG